jgi:hypothetical protein
LRKQERRAESGKKIRKSKKDVYKGSKEEVKKAWKKKERK